MEISKSANFALVIAGAPKTPNNRIMQPHENWRAFLADISRQESLSKDFEKLSESVWLIPLHENMQLLNLLLTSANDKCIPLYMLFLDANPTWIKFPPDAFEKSSQK